MAPVGANAPLLQRLDSVDAARSLHREIRGRRSSQPEASVEFTGLGVPKALYGAKQRHTLYGVAIGGIAGGAMGLVASNLCKSTLCQDQRVPVTLTSAGAGAIVGALIGWFVVSDDP